MNSTENCFITTYRPSFMVHWWVLLVHSGGLGIHQPKFSLFFPQFCAVTTLAFIHKEI
jgi:hypothetical protein